jgi:two-component system sensor histidine kinase KdpD
MQRSKRGRLKIFLGAAPGVGKTFEMLSQARRQQAEGVDVVIGIVETHGRAETQTLVQGLPQLPRRALQHRARELDELDLDAVLQRHPQLVLIDELAHSNVPGSRHAKRHQDVQELLDEGIDVYTTLNVQHLESYNDLVMRITGVEVRETVPDAVLDMATDIELIDLPPDELIERLHQGKVYVPAQAQRALENFFTRGNLLALRELALRAASEHVDDDLANFMRAQGIAGPWPTRGRLLVCVDATPASEAILRSTKRLADQRHLPWTALFVQTLDAQHYAGKQAQLELNLALAAELGGESASITADRIGEGVLEYARACNAAQIVVGRSHSARWRRALRSSLAEWLVAHGVGFEITVVSTEADSKSKFASTKKTASKHWLSAITDRMLAYGIGTPAAATTLVALASRWLPAEDLQAFFLIAVAAAGAFGGLAAALWSCLLGFLSYNFFFTSPRFSLQVSSANDVRILISLLIVGTVVGLLSGRLKRQAVDARTNTLRTAMLFDFSRRLATAVDERDLRQAAAKGIEEILGVQCLILACTADGNVAISAELQRTTDMRDTDVAAANWSAAHHELAGAGTGTLPAAAWCFLPLLNGAQAMGVMALQARTGADIHSAEARRLLFSLQAQLATSWQRFVLLKHAEAAKVQRAAEGLRSALLASVSHDLRTPLVSVIGSLSAMHELAGKLSAEDQSQLVSTALLEAERLNRLIQNLLDATRLAQGGMGLQLTAVAVDEVMRSAVQRLGATVAARTTIDVPTSLPAARGDRALLEQTLINLLENAVKYSPADAPILLAAKARTDKVLIAVTDGGPGIDPQDQARIFDFFYRASQRDTGVVGSGLGLAICKGFIEAMGGKITVQSAGEARGSIFMIELPIEHESDRPAAGSHT